MADRASRRTAAADAPAPAGLQPPHNCPLATCASLAEGQRELEAIRAELARETRALQGVRRRARRQALLGQESDHRLLNGLQLVASLLSLQARRTANPEAAAALRAAAARVTTIGSLHRRLHGRTQAQTLDLSAHLQSVCDELLEMVAADGRIERIRFEGSPLQVPRTLGVPLGFIAAEFVTNAMKYGAGEIIVRLGALDDCRHILSVDDQGPGLPAAYDPDATRGLGMKIVASLLRDLDADFSWGRGERGRGARFSVSFVSGAQAAGGA